MSEVYRLIEPGPVVLVSTMHGNRANIMIMSNIPTVELAKKVVACGNTSGSDVDKSKKVGFTPSRAASVRAPLIDECYANLECKVIDTKLVTQYGIFILEVVKAWIDCSRKHPRTIHHQGNGRFIIDGETLKVRSTMK